jgi:hypothetical protein
MPPVQYETSHINVASDVLEQWQLDKPDGDDTHKFHSKVSLDYTKTQQRSMGMKNISI